jgi:putative Ig domain-containing protein/parallel beta helix pectate lyase-like protein
MGSGTLFTNVRIANAGSCTGTSGCTSSTYAFFSEFSNRVDAWNGASLYSNGAKIFIFGGGDADYAGNESTSVDLVGKTISNIYPPSCFNYSGSGSIPCAATSTNAEALPDGSISTRHSYGGLVCVDRHGYCYMFSGGLYGGTVSRYMWKFPTNGTAATQWVQTAQFSTTATSPNAIACADYVAGDALLCVLDGSVLYSYSYSSDVWTGLRTSTFPNGPGASGFVVDPYLNIGIMAGNYTGSGVGINWIDLTGSDSYAVHDVTATANPTCGGLLSGQFPGLAFDPNDNLIVGKAQEGSTVYELNPGTWTCQTDNPSGAPANTTTSHGLFGRWAYSAALNQFVTLNEYNQDVFAYQRDYGLGHSTMTCIDRDGDGYGTGPQAFGPYTDLVITGPPISTPSPPSVAVVGTPGTTSYYYFLSTCSALPVVSCTVPSAGSLVTTANATLNSSNYVSVTWTDTSNTYMLFRATTSTVPSGTGGQVLGVPTCSAGTCTVLDQSNATLSTAVSPSGFVTSAAHPFTSADIGRVLHITSGTGFTLRDGVSIETVVSGEAGLSSVVGTAGLTNGNWEIDGCLGPDADDLDASVHTGAQAIAKWGSLKAFLAHQGYSPGNFWWVDPAAGSDSNTCHDTDANSASGTPCQTLNHVLTGGLAAGDMVILRQGTYPELISSMAQGSTNSPIIYKAYPGEVSTATNASGYGIVDLSWFILDGLRVMCPQNGGTGFAGGTDDYQSSSLFHDIIFRHLESTNCSDGMYSFNGLVNITIEDSDFHDQHGTTGHGLYIGSRELPGSNVTIRRNLLIGNDYSGMQFNGRVTNLIVEQNIVYSNRLVSGISFENGVSHSFVQSNLIFSNQKAGLIFAIYDYDYHQHAGQATCPLEVSGNCDCTKPNEPYCPYDETYNLIENNTFYQTGFDRDGNGTVFGNIVINAQDTDFPRDMGHNTFRNNIFYGGPDSQHTPIFAYYNELSWNPESTPANELAWFATDTFDHNIVKGLSSSTNVLQFFDNDNNLYGAVYTCAGMSAITTFPNGTSTDCQNVNPQFTAALPAYYDTPASFNFTPASGSPAIGSGSTTLSLASDNIGMAFGASSPNIGGMAGVTGCTITTSSFPAGTDTQSYSQTASESGCTSSTWSVASGSLPSWASLNSSTGAITGTVSGTGTATFTLSYSSTTSGSLSIVSNAAPVITTSSPLPGGTVGSPYSTTIVASPTGTTPDSWSITSGSVPGLSLAASTGVLSGTPTTTSGSPFSLTIMVTDVNGVTNSSGFSLTINPAPSSGIPVSISGKAGAAGLVVVK